MSKVVITGGCGLISLCLALIGLAIYLATKMFEYSLWACFDKEVPWYFDLLGGTALNGLNFPIWAICLITAQFKDTPFFLIN